MGLFEFMGFEEESDEEYQRRIASEESENELQDNERVSNEC